MTQPTEPVSIESLVNQIAGYLAHGGGLLTSGDVAGFRRMDPRSAQAPFFKLAGLVLENHLPNNPQARDRAEERWAAIVVGLAHLGPLHQPHSRLGRALVDAQYSELRFARLLRADTERLLDELPTLARFLTAKRISTDWASAAQLILSADRVHEERVRRALARDYYSALAAQPRN